MLACSKGDGDLLRGGNYLQREMDKRIDKISRDHHRHRHEILEPEISGREDMVLSKHRVRKAAQNFFFSNILFWFGDTFRTPVAVILAPDNVCQQ